MNQTYTTKQDVHVNQTLTSGAYKGAIVRSIAKNGWLKCQWPDGRKFSARVHWLQLNK